MKNVLVFSSVCVLVLAFFTGCLSTAKAYPLPESYPADISPWPDSSNNILDSVIFSVPFSTGKYDSIEILPIDSKDVVFDYRSDDENDKNDEDAVEIAKSYLGNIDTLFLLNFKKAAATLNLPVSPVNTATSSSALVVKARVLVVDPGSRSARYWIGMGAGATALKMEITLVDGSTGKVIAVATDFDNSLGGSYGGDSYELLEANMEEIVQNCFANLLVSLFAQP